MSTGNSQIETRLSLTIFHFPQNGNEKFCSAWVHDRLSNCPRSLTFVPLLYIQWYQMNRLSGLLSLWLGVECRWTADDSNWMRWWGNECVCVCVSNVMVHVSLYLQQILSWWSAKYLKYLLRWEHPCRGVWENCTCEIVALHFHNPQGSSQWTVLPYMIMPARSNESNNVWGYLNQAKRMQASNIRL